MSSTTLYGGVTDRRITVRDLAAAKERGERWPMVTAYDAMTARVFDRAGIPVLLVGDSAAMVVYGYDSTLPVTVDDLLPLTAAVVRGSSRALVVADLPCGSYQASPEQALESAARIMKEAGARAVQLECGRRVLPPAAALVPAELAERVTASLSIPTIGIGAGAATDAQVLVWQDMAGLTPSPARFVKRYADLGAELGRAARTYAEEVVNGAFPGPEHAYR